MKKYIFILAFLISLGTFISCDKDFLDIKPIDRLSDDAVWNDESLLTAFVNQIHANSIWSMMDHEFMVGSCTDETYMLGARGDDVYLWGLLSTDNEGVLGQWSGRYSTIAYCNTYLEKISISVLPEYVKNKLTGQVKFMRAYLYFELNKRFNGVPIIDKPFSSDGDFNVPRNTYEECLSFMLKDLDDAASLLKDYPMTGADVGRVTYGAALALKSRILLHAASPLVNPTNDKAKWQKAADAAKAVIDLGKYSLVDNYSDIWNVKRNSEVIWDKAYVDKNRIEGFNLWNQIASLDGWGGNAPTQNLVDDFELLNGKLPKDDPEYDPQNPYINRDPRFYASILYNGALYRGLPYDPWLPGGKDSPDCKYPWCASKTGGYSLKKFMQESVVGVYGSNQKNGDQHAILIRLGEIYLNYAEAMYHLGAEDIAREYINKIRQRPSVNMPPVTESGEELYKRIQHERRIELVFEEFRFDDVRRWKIAIETENQPFYGVHVLKNSDGSFTYNYYKITDRVFKEQHYWHPIPRYELEKDNKLVQNPGYN